ncbi:STAS domain-containing protein [Paludibaculum fermentans]|uniref:STAS domain-containing protein n=1 Tax=Paludibaculum fermentans TaxID=1473598 RepID=A0A7S7NN82_PALFE|nr:STAS domain-containing protein [Paludibaculum fermentans]QOY86732.1 STAS domain-containing protein [Paludibaculum fermentans]
MPFSLSRRQNRQLLKLEGTVTIRHAQDLAAKLGESPDYGASVEVDTSSLEDIDTCVLQLLCSLRKTAPALSFAHPSDAFVRAVDRCGMRREFFRTRESL